MSFVNMKFGALAVALALLMGIFTVQMPMVSASPDSDNTIPELRIDGPTNVDPGDTLVQTVQIDDDVPGDVVKGVQFKLLIPEICEPSSVEVTISPAFNNHVIPSTSNVVFIPPNDHKVIVLAIALNNIPINPVTGLDVATIQCTVRDIDAIVLQTFSEVAIIQEGPTEVQGSTGEDKEITVGVPVIKFGDVNGDGVVNILDVIKMAKHILEIELLNANQTVAADVFPAIGSGAFENRCGDGVVNITDIEIVLTAIVQLNTDAFLDAQCKPPP